MVRLLFRVGFGAATIAGGVYLYKQYGRGKRREVIAHVTGVVLGEKIGEITGYAVGGPIGAVVGSIAGAVSGAMIAEDRLLLEAARRPKLIT